MSEPRRPSLCYHVTGPVTAGYAEPGSVDLYGLRPDCRECARLHAWFQRVYTASREGRLAIKRTRKRRVRA